MTDLFEKTFIFLNVTFLVILIIVFIIIVFVVSRHKFVVFIF